MPGVVTERVDEVLTERLRLRRWTAADLEPFAALNADGEVMAHFPAPLSRAESDAFVERIERRFAELGVGLWALERRADGAFLGFTGLNPMPPGTPGEGELEVGWRLARFAWGQGYASEAARVALDAAWGQRRSAVWSMTATSNVASQRVMQRIGMTRHSTFEHPALPVGHPLRPHVAYRIAAPGP
jgi:RimJ/RimL family protein N-acetyltransferase